MQLKDKRVLVVGFERTGRAAARFLAARGARVLVTDRKPAEAFGGEVRELSGLGVAFELGGHRPEAFLEADLIVLNDRRADIEQANARAAARAERELAEALAQAREELAQLTGTDTAEDRRAAIERSYRDLRARLAAENDAAGVSLIDRLISVRAAQANLAKLEQEWRLVTERLRNAQEAIQIQQQAGLLTEAQARRQIVALQQQ